MATKTLSVTEDAYLRLVRLKRPRESFSDVIGRITGKEDLRHFAGAISADFADELASASRDFRTRLSSDANRRGG